MKKEKECNEEGTRLEIIGFNGVVRKNVDKGNGHHWRFDCHFIQNIPEGTKGSEKAAMWLLETREFPQ